jgi:hypothetical protein
MTLGSTAPWKKVALGVLIIGLVAIIATIFRQGPKADSGTGGESGITDLPRTLRIFWLCFLVYPITMVIADAVRDTHTFLVWKTSIILLPLAILSVVLLLQQLRRPRMRKLAFGLCTLIVFSATVTNVVASTLNGRRRQREIVLHLRENDRENHVVVVSTQSRGRALTALVHWKNHGVRDVRITRASRKNLDRVMASLATDPAVAQITLIRFGKKSKTGLHWLDEEVDRALAIGAATGRKTEFFKARTLYTDDVGR